MRLQALRSGGCGESDQPTQGRREETDRTDEARRPFQSGRARHTVTLTLDTPIHTRHTHTDVMGCGSSTAQPVVLPVAIPAASANSSEAVNSEGAGADAAPTSSTATGSEPTKDEAKTDAANEPAKELAVEPAVESVESSSPPSPPQEKKQLVTRNSGDAASAPPATDLVLAAVTDVSTVCDIDASHSAAVWCSSCETNLCEACDAASHADVAASSHTRTLLATGAVRGGPSAGSVAPGEKKGKFMVRSQPTASEGSGVSTGETSTPVAALRSKFRVAKFVEATEADDVPDQVASLDPVTSIDAAQTGDDANESAAQEPAVAAESQPESNEAQAETPAAQPTEAEPQPEAVADPVLELAPSETTNESEAADQPVQPEPEQQPTSEQAASE